jgi:2-polyprenyl-3-methyl-5-hydroxy-6-metoxy-1,4-benzoquinol methylase
MKRNHKREWFDDDAFWRDLFPFMFPAKRFADAIREMDQALKLTKPEGRLALDLCCGPGRCSVALARRGFSVTGVDRTRWLLAQAKRRARAARVRIEWVQADMRDFVRPGTFDLVLSMFTSFGYFDDKREDLTVLQNMFASLRPGGTCLIDVVSKEYLARVFQPIQSETLPDGTRLVRQHEIFDDWTRIRDEWTVIRKGRAKSYRFHHTVYSGQELRDLMGKAGFIDVRLYGNLEGDGYGTKAQRLIAAGRKPKARKGKSTGCS